MSNLQCLVRVLLHEQDRGASSVDLLDDRENLIDQHRCRPIDGSSSSSTFGSLMSARPIASICCSPPDSVPPACRLRSARRGKGHRPWRGLSRSRHCARMHPCGGSLPLSCREDAATLRCLTDAGEHSFMARHSRDDLTVEANFALGNGTQPDGLEGALPAPLAPISVTISPSSTSNEMPLMASIFP